MDGNLMVENRSARRTRVLRNGRIVFNNAHSAVGCLVTDLSPFGARLEVPMGFLCPDSFRLDLPGAAKRQAEVIWAANRLVGVRFVDGSRDDADAEAAGSDADSETTRSALLRRITAIENELVLLRRELEACLD